MLGTGYGLLARPSSAQGAFAKTSPANGAIVATTVTLQWDVSAGATTYWVCLDKTNNNACDTAWLTVGTAQSATFNDLAAGTTYYWQVEAQAGSTFTPADNGVWRSLSTQPEPLPASFVKFGPLTTYTGINPVLTWQQSAGATNYQYCVDAAPDPTPNGCDSGWVSVGTLLSVDLRGLTGGGTYLWQVRAQNASGTTEATNGWATITSTYPSSSAFSKTSPAKGATVPSGFVTVAYTPSSTANYYVYCVDTIDNNSCDQPTGFTGQYFVIGGVHPTISIPIPDGGTRYYWQLVGVTLGAQHITAADAGLWHSFDTTSSNGKPGAFWKTSSTPAGSTVTLSWGASLGAEGYEYCIDTSNNNACDNGVWRLPGGSGLSTFTAVSGLSGSTTYHWQVRAANLAGNTEANGGTWRSFTTGSTLPTAFAKLSPADAAGAQPPSLTLDWAASSQATSYRVCIDRSNDITCDAGWLSVAAMTDVSIRDGAGGATFFWQVAAANGDGVSLADHLNWWRFTTSGVGTCEVTHPRVANNNVVRPTTGDAGIFESMAPDAPPTSLLAGAKGLHPALDAALVSFAAVYNQAVDNEPLPHKPYVTRRSGYRPPAYQQHFRDLLDISRELGELENQGLSPACEVLLDDVNHEIDVRHGIFRASGAAYDPSFTIGSQLPTVSQAGSSHHEQDPSFAVDLSKANVLQPPANFDLNAALCAAGLARPYPGDKVHVTLNPTTCAPNPVVPATVEPVLTSVMVVSEAALKLLVTDPLGHRVGFDPQTGLEVNELGADASYSGASTKLQVVMIYAGVEGDYSVSAVGTTAGQYEVRAYRLNESGEVIDTEVWSGSVAPGQSIAPPPLDTTSPPLDVAPPVVTAPSSITVNASEIGGARASAVPALAAFLSAGSAVDGVDQAPQRLSPTVGNQDASSSTLFPVGTTTVTFRYQDASFNIGTATADVTVSSNVVANGDFSNGTTGWQQFATPDLSYIVSNVVGGVFEYHRVPPPAGTTNQAVVFRETGFPVPIDTPLLAQFDLGNSSSVRKRISVLILDSNFSDLSVCTFWIPANSPLQTYQMQTHTTKAWTNAAIYFYAATAGSNGGAYRLDNVSLQYAPGESASQTECFDPNVPLPPGGLPESDLLVNGDFGTGLLPPWQLFGQITSQIANGVFEFIRTPGTPAGVVFQSTGQAMNANQIMTATFDLGNSSSVRKRVTVIMHDSNFSDLSACTFWLAPGQPLSPYVMRTYATQAWTNATLSVYGATVGPDQWIRLDNATFRRTPGTAIAGTDCVEPATPALLPGDASLAPTAGRRVARPVVAATAVGVDDQTAVWQLDLRTGSPPILQVPLPVPGSDAWLEIQIRPPGEDWTTIALVPAAEARDPVEFALDAFSGQLIEVRVLVHRVD